MAAETATILVTDLSGSTELRVALGEEQAEMVRRQHDSVLADVAHRSGGTVVKGLGDGVLVRFPGAAEAVAASVAMQQGIESLGRRERAPLQMRVGVSSGDVTLEDGDCFGLPVIEASRLCDAAEPGQILIAEVVSVLARGRGGHDVVNVGTRELRGLTEPISVNEVKWEPARSVADLRAQSPYVGREAERKLILERFAAAAEGAGALVLVVGEPGIGKTRLVGECTQEMTADGDALVLTGVCHDGEVAAYAPLVEAFTGWLRRTPADDVRAALGPDAAVIAQVVPAIGAAFDDLITPAQLSPDEEARRLHDAVGQVLERLALDQPVVVVLDDLHWADDATVGLMRALARRAQQLRLLVIGTYRDTDLDRRHPLAKALPIIRREVEPTRVGLEGLSPDAVNELLERISESEVPEEFSKMLTQQSEGNPFFLREMLLHLVDEGALRQEDDVWVADPAIATVIPEGVREVVGRRLSQLPDTANRILSVGALFRVAFPLPVAAAIAELDEDTALDAIDQALDAQIIHATETFDHYAFSHALFRQTLNEELNPSRQVRTHRAIAEALEKQLIGEPDVAQAAMLAHHWYQSAALPGAERGVNAAMIVAGDAVDRYAATEAFDAYTIALELAPAGDERLHDIQRARIEAAIRCRQPAADVTDQVVEFAESLAQEHGTDHAAHAVAELIKVARAVFGGEETPWALAEIGRRYLDDDRRDATWAIIRLNEIRRLGYEDPTSPGIPVDSPESRELQAVLESTDPILLGDLPWAPSTREARRARLSAPGPETGRLMAAWGLGELHQVREIANLWIDEYSAQGNPGGLALFSSLAARSETVLGEHDAALESYERAVSLIDRIPIANAFQVVAAKSLMDFVRGEITPPEEQTYELFPVTEDPDLKWASLTAMSAWGAAHADGGERDLALGTITPCMVGIERAPGHSPNYVLLAALVSLTMYLLDESEQLETLERNVRTKIIEPDVRYPESDGRLIMARLCSVGGRIDEARTWLDESRLVMNEQGSVALHSMVERYAADIEIRNAARGGEESRARDCIAASRALADHPVMAPTHARLDELEALADDAWS